MEDSDLHTATLHHFLDRMQRGEAEARDDLLRRISDRLERLCRKMFGAYPSLRNFEETGDVYQNAVLRYSA